ncbi:hypothetical protein N5J23_00340 [Comamonas aquatica]|uniref:Uncharacterized protein n=2 Tax=Comamonas aquatica TaxID=225991 RepID=A0AA42W029_9BURK|nr:hypothetical protein [Comamonas aquatica]MDH1426790.1 hypothetical protein [Comamonas aquatica]MDH1604267.1 hypothetical protein [Comamonas aquatica]MDH1616159.1 hypothetical protein [Comamonas aquatica]MDH1812887.1 hypothetical protein [Comamonas aquatica]MDH2004008.1 hypothetical protein [Comamonas aquatica]
MEKTGMYDAGRLKKYFQSTHRFAQPAGFLWLWISGKCSPGSMKKLSTLGSTELSTDCVQIHVACDGDGISAHHAGLAESTLRRVRLICCKNYFLTVRLVAMTCNFVYLFSKTPTNIADASGCLCIFL